MPLTAKFAGSMFTRQPVSMPSACREEAAMLTRGKENPGWDSQLMLWECQVVSDEMIQREAENEVDRVLLTYGATGASRHNGKT